LPEPFAQLPNTSKIAESDTKMGEFDKAMAKAKKVAKMEFPKAPWSVFGISGKQ
jgi:hypothetical protein